MDAATVGVLRDVTLLVCLALVLGMIVYQWIRATRPAAEWSNMGKVDAGLFLWLDGLVVAGIAALLLSGLMSGSHEAAGAAAETAQGDLELNSGSLFLNILFQLIICSVLLFYLRGLRDLNPLELFGFRRVSLGKAGVYSLLFMIPTIILILLFSHTIMEWMKDFWPKMEAQQTVEAFRNSTDPLAKGMLVVAAVIVAPLVEETVFRGFIYGVLKRFTDGFFAAICSSLLFAVVHLHVGSMFPLAALALVFCLAYEVTGSLAVPMIMHGIFNGTSILTMILFPDQIQQ